MAVPADMVRTQSPTAIDSSLEHDIDVDGSHHFSRAHAGRNSQDHPVHHNMHAPLAIRHLLKPPVVRQWLRQGRMFKGSKERAATYVELFFDLMFVGIIHQLAESAVEPEPSWWNVVKFIFVFYASWSVWSHVRDFVNQSGVDDIFQRIFVLLNMVLLLGFSANATGIEIEHVTDPAEGELGTHINPETYSAIHAAVAFLLVAKGVRILLFVVYMISLPRFREAMAIQMLQLLIPCFIWLPLTWVPEGRDGEVVALAATAIGLELALRWVFTFAYRWTNERSRAYGWYTPALSIEHMMERISAFVVIVLGESILNATFAAHGSQVGVDNEYARGALAIVIAFEIMWLYFDADSSRMFIHALRRHWVTSIIFIQIHWILCGALIMTSAAQKEMVLYSEVDSGFRWYFGGGLGLAVLVTAIIGVCHDSLDKAGTAWLPRWLRLTLRVLIAILFALIPLTPNHSTTLIFGYHAAILALLIFVETVGKLGSEGDWHNPDLEESDRSDSNDPNQSPGEKRKPSGLLKHQRDKGRIVSHEELTETEKGEEDAGVESGMTDIEVRPMHRNQRLAFTV